jgi:hypothetical protein
MEPQQNIRIFAQLWPQGMAADVGMGGFSQGPGNPGNVMIYVTKIGHTDPVLDLFPVSESCCEGTPGTDSWSCSRRTKTPKDCFGGGRAQEGVHLPENKFSFNQQVFLGLFSDFVL